MQTMLHQRLADTEPGPEEYIERAWVALQHETYAEILAGERAHDHRIIKDQNGVYRWDTVGKQTTKWKRSLWTISALRT
jgi:hypothetical protein